ncbi:chromosome segregation protein SMC [Streptococcus phocae subsp. salmonis]|uniref:chromosome segregation protein SMC n=1 Tax=Streptococcus phocae TaxID=119224 RepID=UPI0005317D1C|nr:chromosome segregation protein SMC [Streptococcus phocae]KGR73145.1 chromosome segregation protein SMC [Streptococcus phocae subsp. salmonis]
MFLKEIEMQGFKSFADKTKIEFDKGVTAVVGPNGSGKSNITESLRWALGESSAKSLRGGKMPDVIFSGTDKRNPLNYAQVSVVLDNSDAFIKDAKEEIRIERHIYRNGDSDYLIDGRKVRLRDIHDLFMDTGLGRDSFSIISQGRVEEIFNSKPEDRRAIFEEAAGVLKYKTRKKETQSKLQQTQDNLDRLDDIVYELEHQVIPLEKQAKTAKQFLTLDSERKQLQLDILVTDIEQNQAQKEACHKDLDQLQKALADYHTKRDDLQKSHQALKSKRQSLNQVSDHTQTQLLELTKLISDLERRIELIHLETSQKQAKKEEASQRLGQLTEQLESFQSEYQQKSDQLATIEQELALLTVSLSDLTKELERFSTDPDQAIENLRESFVGLMQKEAQISNRLTILQADLDKEEQAREAYTQEYQAIKDKVEQLEKECHLALERYEMSQSEVSDLLNSYHQLETAIGTLEQRYQQEQTQLFDLLDQQKAKEARKNSLEAIQKNHSQFYAGVRSVLQAAQQLGGILGAVSEHLTFDRTYQTALEIALGASSQHVIVTDEAAAKRAIAHLKANRQGRATFLPLTTIKSRSLSKTSLDQLISCPGYLGTAESLVTYDDKLAAIFQYLLGTTVVFETIDQANQAAKRLQYKVRIVTLDGTELRPGGSFAGGANRQNNTTFIQPELDQVLKDLSQLSDQLREAEATVTTLKEELTDKKTAHQQLKQAGETARLAEQKHQLAYQQVKEQLNDAQALLATFATGQNHSSEDLLTEKSELETELNDVTEAKRAITTEIEQLKAGKTVVKETKDRLEQDLSQARLRQRDLLSEQKFETANQHRINQQINQTQADIRQLKDLLSSHINQDDKAHLPTLKEQLAEAQRSKEAYQEKLVTLRFDIEDKEAQLEELASQLAKETQQNEQFIRQQTKLEGELEQVTNRLRAYAKLLSEEFQMTLSEAKQTRTTIDNLALAKQRLQALQKDIKALGPINSDAIAQFEEVNERLTFLKGQKEDLMTAKNLLTSTIDNMDAEVKARFKVTFEAIRNSFKETFTQMFGGGSADLLLTEGNLLSAGIEIAVQPPGKNIQSLNLMSGGEKALSALALLFAIIRVKTIPFVILDEVEAALDEANVKRFGDYLNRFDKDSQFIVVTHRKGTMAAADSIYGITMQESGVSKVVSVKLKDSKELTFLS